MRTSPNSLIGWLMLLLIAVAATPALAPAALRHHHHHPRKPAKYRAIASAPGHARLPVAPGPINIPDAQFEPLAWSDLGGWAQDHHAEALVAFRSSCHAVLWQAKLGHDRRPILPALAEICRQALTSQPQDAREFFENHFRPLRINKLGDAAGFLTGYYEPVVEGSRFPTRIFTVPVYRRPDDLVPPTTQRQGQGFPNSGRAMRRLMDGSLVPYYERGEIEEGALDGRQLEICWLKDPIDLFYIQIQGSGRVRLEDGTTLRINYDAHNGHPYTAVGRILIERKLVARDEMSMERIREWMNANPEPAKEVRRQNKSYVFFRVVGLSDDQEAVGAQGVPLVPQRSIAVDSALHVYGTPFFIEANLPIETSKATTGFHRLMIAQDTGSAIVGPARADIYFGAGDDAGLLAGRLRHAGLFALLIPRALDPVLFGAHMPLPKPRPDIEALTRSRADVLVEVPLPRPRPKFKLGGRWRA